jgi:predicted ATPase
MPTNHGARGVILTEEGLSVLNQALEKWWHGSVEKQASKTKKLTREKKAIGLGGLEVKTVDRIFRRQTVDEVSLRKAFNTLNIKPVFSRERYCVPASPPSGSIPQLPAGGIGRETEMGTIKRLLQSNRLVTLTGAGGVGKTWLAKQIAQEIKGQFASGIWFVDLAGLAEDVDRSLVEQRIAITLGVQEQKNRPLLQTLLTFLRERPLLLILDNCEHLLDACATLTDHLLSSSTSLRVLATSRERLNIPFERPYVVPSLAVPNLKRLSETPGDLVTRVLEYDSVRLFVERASNLRDFTVTDQNALLLATICRRLDGIPLAIELAAAHARSMPLVQLDKELHNCFRILIGGSRAALPRHRTLRATMDWSYNLLNAREQTLLRRLSVFAEGCTREAVEQVCCGDGLEMWEAMVLLTALIDKSLVVYKEDSGKERYILLETVRQYGRDWLVKSGESHTLPTRHRDYFLALVEQAEPELAGSEPAEWLQRLDAEHGNLQAGLEWSLLAEDAGASLRFCGALSPFWWTQGYLSEGRQWCKRALEIAGGQGRTAERAKALNGAGALAFHQSDYVVARSYHEAGRTLWQELGDAGGVARSLQHLGQTAHYQSDYISSRSYYTESLALLRERGECGTIIGVLNSLGDVAAKQGDGAFARSCHEESLTLCREIGDRGGIARALLHLGHTVLNQGDIAAAISFYEQCLTICEEIGDRRGIIRALSGLGHAAQIQGNYPLSRTCFERNLALFREAGDRRSIANTLKNIGFSIYCEGNLTTALAYFTESRALYQEIGDRQGVAYALTGLASVAQSQGNYPTAASYLHQCLILFREVGDQNGIANALSILGNLAYACGDYAVARAYLAEGVELFLHMGSRSDIAQSLGLFAELATCTGDLERAARLWGTSESLQQEVGWSLSPERREQFDLSQAQARRGLGAEAFSAAWAVGQKMTLDQAMEYALVEPTTSPTDPNCAQPSTGAISRLEVA